ncbi:MAG: hypothetical protein FWH23_02975 [Bacteroidales bacterium]|nr:hypothetical protein [Bacteroidales bacterium]
MKQMKPIVTKTVCGVVASNILLVSCMQGYNFDDSLYGTFTDNPTTHTAMVSISESNLSEELIHQINSINAIIGKIITDKEEAKNFATDPQAYLASQEMNFQIMLSEQEKAVLIALSDNDIANAVRNNDIALFLKICKEKGYINALNESRLPNLYNTTNYMGEEIQEQFIAFFIVVAAVIAVVGALTVTATSTATIAVAAVKVKTIGLEEQFLPKNCINTIEPVLKIWTDNNGLIADTVLYDEFIEYQTNEIVDIIVEKENIVPDTKKEQMRHFLKLQLEGYYGLRK